MFNMNTATKLMFYGSITAAIIAAHMQQDPFFPSFTGDRAPNKPYKTFQEFFPFYLQEHSDDLNKILHAIGTSLVIVQALFRPMAILAMIFAGSVGYALCSVFSGMPNGIAEGAATVVLLILCYGHLNGNFKGILPMLLTGYSFAWVGHFFVEHNKPATFVYPVFSLCGDFVMFYQIITGQLPINLAGQTAVDELHNETLEQ